MFSDTDPILAIDTATQNLSLTLRAGGRLYRFHEAVGSSQSREILPQTGRLLDQAGIGVSDLRGIVYAQGPGAFTGLRIGIAVAQGLAFPYNTPLYGIPSLDAAAYLLPPSPCVLAAADARMGEVFYAWFDTVLHRRLSPYQVGRAADIRQPENTGATAADVSAVGSAFALESPPPFSGCPAMPRADDYLNLAATGRYPATDAAAAQLLYVRDKIALTAAEQAARKAAA